MEKILTIASMRSIRAVSVAGNPRFRVTFTNGLVANTKTDSQVNYLIDNSEYHDGPIVVTFTPDGHISHVTRHNS